VDPDHKLGNYSLTTNNGTLTVSAAPLTVTADPQNKWYGQPDPALTYQITSGALVNGDTLSGALSRVAGENVGTYGIVQGTLAVSPNYALSYVGADLTIARAYLAVRADDKQRVYGVGNPVLSGTISGVQNGDNITATYATAATVGSPVGSYPITPTLVDPDGRLSNYTVSSANGTLAVEPAVLTGVADGKSRLYGASNPLFTVTYSGFVNGQDASLVAGTLSGSSPAQTNSPVGSYPIRVWGQSAPNYSIAYVEGTLTVLPTPLLVRADNTNRAYGQFNPGFTATISGWVNGEGLGVLGGALELSSPATTNSPVGSYPIIPTGLTSTNYALSYTNGTLTVAAYGLSVTANDQSRVYGAANPVLTGSVVGLQNGDNISVIYATAAGTNSGVGNYPITIGLVDPDHKLGNYSLTTNNGTLTVSAAPLTVTADPKSRFYGYPDPVLTYRITSGELVNGDSLSGALSRVSGENAGTYAIVQGTLGAGTNYALSYVRADLTIIPTYLAVRADDQQRVYGATNPVLSGTISGIQNGENITATYATAATMTSPVGAYPIVPTLVDPSGKLSNYAVSSTSGTLTVTAAPLSVVASNAFRTYGAANPVLTGSVVGLQNEDNISATYSTSVGTNSGVGSYPITIGLDDPDHKLGNYNLTTNNGILTVTPAPLTVTADPQNKWYGQPDPVLTYRVTSGGLVNGDALSGALSRVAGENVGTYGIVQGTLAVSPNYALSYVGADLTIAPAYLAVRADDKQRVYGAANPVLTGSVVGLQNGDDVSAVYATAAGTNSGVGSYPITIALLDPDHKLGNYSLTTNNGSLAVTPAALTVTANNVSRPYGAPDPVFTGAIAGLQNGDNITATYATAATQISPVGTYSIVPSLVDPGHKLPNYVVASINGTLTITATTTPVILSILPTNGSSAVITWTSISNSVYRVQYKANLASTNWISLAPDMIATSGTTSFTDHPAGAPQRYYRILFVSTEPPPPPVIRSIVGAGTPTVVITWSAASNRVYRVQYKANLTSTGWFNLAPDVTALGGTASFTDYPGDAPQRFYRVVLLADATPLIPLVVVADNATRVYGAANPAFSGTLTGVHAGDSITATYSTTATPTSSVGSYSITPTLVDPNGKLENYLVSFTNGTLTVTAAPLIVTATNTSRPFGTTNPTLGGTVTGLWNGDNITATYATTATLNSPPGTYPIVPTLVDLGNRLPNYAVTLNSGTLTVTAPTAPTISSIVRSPGASDITLTWASVSNGVYRVQYKTDLAGTSWFNLAPDVTATGSTASFTDHPGAAPQRFYRVVRLLAATPLTPLVVVANNATRVYGATNPVLSGTLMGVQAGDDITATYFTTAMPASSVGSYPITPTLVDPTGKLEKYLVSITNGTLTVTKAALTVTANDATRAYGAANPPFSGTITGLQNGDNITATYATAATVNSPAGTYSITPTLVDPGSKLPNYAVTLRNGTLTITGSTAPTITSIASSPANTNLTITWIAVSNSVYRVQYKTSLNSTNWIDLAPDVIATGSTASHTDNPHGAPQRYYRVLLVSTAPAVRPVIRSLTGAGTTNVVITWSSVSNQSYHLQYKTNLSATNWSDLAPNITAAGSTASFTDHPITGHQRYYRVMLLP
jgi:hypothetical protein